MDQSCPAGHSHIVWMPRFALRASIILLLSSLVVSCGGTTTPPAVAPATPQALAAPPLGTPPAATPASVVASGSLDEILWVVDFDPATGAPRTVTNRYPVAATRITAAALARGLPPGAVIAATWSYNNTSLDAFATELELTEDAPRRWLTFHLSRAPATPWPAGTYAIALSLEDEILRRAEVEVGDGQ